MFFSPGCPAENAEVPFDTKDINMSEYLISARAENFIGRQWLYRDVEDAFKDDSVAGVLIIGNPGTGKSAWALRHCTTQFEASNQVELQRQL